MPPPFVKHRLVEVGLRPEQIGARGCLIGLPHLFLARKVRIVFAHLAHLPSRAAKRRLCLIDGEPQIGVVQFDEQVASMNRLAVYDEHTLHRAANQRRHL
ncbi:hypothetical protein D9M73_94570 [compost metagenome]